jgi:hypothetical protein
MDMHTFSGLNPQREPSGDGALVPVTFRVAAGADAPGVSTVKRPPVRKSPLPSEVIQRIMLEPMPKKQFITPG